MRVIVPCVEYEMKKAVFAAAEMDGPVYLRVARPVVDEVTSPDTPFVPGKAIVLREGSDVAIIACGLMVKRALDAAKLLEAEGISAAVINMHTIKPIDRDTILAYNSKVKAYTHMQYRSRIWNHNLRHHRSLRIRAYSFH